MKFSLGFLILAAGKGTRMHSDQPKVLQSILGKPLLGHVFDALQRVSNDRIWTIIGHKAEMVRAAFESENRQFVVQREQLGTGHALAVAWPQIQAAKLDFLCVVNGDTPVVPLETVEHLARRCHDSSAGMGFVSISLENPSGYGRVIRSDSGDVLGIVEEKDFDRSIRGDIREVNSGIYVFDVAKCGPLLGKIDQNNAQREFYITQMLELCIQSGLPVIGVEYDRPQDLLGVNSPRELVDREAALRETLVTAWQTSGVIIRNAQGVFIGPDVVLEPGVEIMGPCEIYGRSHIGHGTRIASHCWIKDASLRACQVKSFSHIEGAVVHDDSVVGPFARLRPGAVIGAKARVGNFVEVKNTVLHEGAKAGHLSYLGDSDIGQGVNIGAGTITCNYDGARKHRTEIKDGAFIGSNTALVAPVVVGAHAVVGAGSVVTKAVPDGALCVARARQANLERKNK